MRSLSSSDSQGWRAGVLHYLSKVKRLDFLRVGSRSRSARRSLRSLSYYLLVCIFMVVVLLPIYHVLLVAFAPGQQFFTTPLTYLPRSLEIVDRYKEIFDSLPVGRYFLNTFVLAAGSSVFAITISFIAAYAIARLDIPGANLVLILLIASTMLPPVSTIIPLFEMFREFKLLNTLHGLLILYGSSILPLSVWVLVSFIRQVPPEVEESAKVDGAGFWTVLFRITLPLIRPGIATIFLIDFIVGWNEFFIPLVFAPGKSLRVLVTAISDAGLVGSREGSTLFFESWGHQMALAILAVAPVFLITLLFQRQIVEGIQEGAYK